MRGMRQFVLFQSAKGCIKYSKRLRAEVERVMIQLDNRINGHHERVLASLRAASATTSAYISQMEDKLLENEDELERVTREIQRLNQCIVKSHEPLRVAEVRLNMREKRPVHERWNDNPEEHLDTEVDGLKNAVCLLEDELENMIAMRSRLQESSNHLETEIGFKRSALDIDTNCFNIQTDWMEFLSKYEVVPLGAPSNPFEPARPPKEQPPKSQAAIESENRGKMHPGWWCQRSD